MPVRRLRCQQVHIFTPGRGAACQNVSKRLEIIFLVNSFDQSRNQARLFYVQVSYGASRSWASAQTTCYCVTSPRVTRLFRANAVSRSQGAAIIATSLLSTWNPCVVTPVLRVSVVVTWRPNPAQDTYDVDEAERLCKEAVESHSVSRRVKRSRLRRHKRGRSSRYTSETAAR